MNYCSTCEKGIKRSDFIIFINLETDEYYSFYTFCSDVCKEIMYKDPEGGEPEDSIERRYNGLD